MTNDELPPLPEPEGCYLRDDTMYIGGFERIQTDEYTADQMQAYAEEAVRLEREACANIAISWSDKSFEAEQIAAEIQARDA